jgi:hypothetical protein
MSALHESRRITQFECPKLSETIAELTQILEDFATRYADLRSFAAKFFQSVEDDREKIQ